MSCRYRNKNWIVALVVFLLIFPLAQVMCSKASAGVKLNDKLLSMGNTPKDERLFGLNVDWPKANSLTFARINENSDFIVYFNGKMLPPVDKIAVGSPVLHPEGKSVAYNSSDKKNGKSSVYVNDKQGKLYDAIDALVYSPDGKKIAYRKAHPFS